MLFAGSNLAISSSQAAHRLRRLFMLRIKIRLALVPLLRLSKSKPHGRYGPRRQLRPSAMPGFVFAGTRDSGDRSARLGKGRRESPRLFRRGRRPRRPEAFPWGKVAAERPDEGRAAVKTLISLAAARQLPPGEAMSGRGVPIPGRGSAAAAEPKRAAEGVGPYGRIERSAFMHRIIAEEVSGNIVKQKGACGNCCRPRFCCRSIVSLYQVNTVQVFVMVIMPTMMALMMPAM